MLLLHGLLLDGSCQPVGNPLPHLSDTTACDIDRPEIVVDEDMPMTPTGMSAKAGPAQWLGGGNNAQD